MIESETPEHEAWSSYSETVLIFAGRPEMVIDLRAPIVPLMKKTLEAIGLASPFAILTSFNPLGKNLTSAENDQRFCGLEAELRGVGLEYLVIDACSPDRAHCERSVAICVDREAALYIARRWEQLAIFWFDLERFWIYAAISAADPISLPRK